METAVGVYTMDQQEVGLFSPKFVLAVSLALAVNICFTLTGKLKLKIGLQNDFLRVSSSAGADDANEQVSPPPRDADWIRDRTGVRKGTRGQDWRPFADGNN